MRWERSLRLQIPSTFPAARKRGLFSSGWKAASGERIAAAIPLDLRAGEGV